MTYSIWLITTLHFLSLLVYSDPPNPPPILQYSTSSEWKGLTVIVGCEVTLLAGEHRLAPGWSSCLTICDWQIAVWEPGQVVFLPGRKQHPGYQPFSQSPAPSASQPFWLSRYFSADLLTWNSTPDQTWGAQSYKIPLFQSYRNINIYPNGLTFDRPHNLSLSRIYFYWNLIK